MLRVLPYILIWLGFWMLYFPVVDINPVTNSIKLENPIPLSFQEVEHAGVSQFGFYFPVEKVFSFFTKSLSVVKQKVWKPWFLGSGLAMFLLALFVSYKEKKSRHDMDYQTLHKIRELEQAALCSQMNPHFLFNVLNSIQSFIMRGDKISSVQYLSTFSRLVRLNLHYSSVPKITLEQELEMLSQYLELEKLRFNGKFDYEFKLEASLEPNCVFLPPMLIQPFIENAILHGLRPVSRKGHITVNLEPKNNCLLVTITDNGIGIDTSKRLKEKTIHYHKSMAMKITKKRLQLLSGTAGVNQKLSVKELVDDNGEVMGTEVRLLVIGCSAENGSEIR